MEYLHTLQERQKWSTPRENLKVGDIVLVVDNAARNSWAMGRIVNVHPDKKGFVRSVTVKTKSSLLQRPIVLYQGKAALGRPPENVLDIL